MLYNKAHTRKGIVLKGTRPKGDRFKSVPFRESERRSLMEQPSTDQLLALLVAQYGTRITPEQRHDVQRVLKRLQDTSRTLRAYPLTNADEPALVFTPYRADEA
jgi:hypothetical protein